MGALCPILWALAPTACRRIQLEAQPHTLIPLAHLRNCKKITLGSCELEEEEGEGKIQQMRVALLSVAAHSQRGVAQPLPPLEIAGLESPEYAGLQYDCLQGHCRWLAAQPGLRRVSVSGY